MICRPSGPSPTFGYNSSPLAGHTGVVAQAVPADAKVAAKRVVELNTTFDAIVQEAEAQLANPEHSSAPAHIAIAVQPHRNGALSRELRIHLSSDFAVAAKVRSDGPHRSIAEVRRTAAKGRSRRLGWFVPPTFSPNDQHPTDDD